MDTYEAWAKALKNTEIIRGRVQSLQTFADTTLPYVFLAESTINIGDTVARIGEVVVARPSLILPPHIPQFDGFEFEGDKCFDEDAFVNFLLIRGINIPSLRYNNKTSALSIYEGHLDKAIVHYREELERAENVQTGLLTGPEDCWQFSILVYICSQIARNAESDIRRLLAEYHKKKG